MQTPGSDGDINYLRSEQPGVDNSSPEGGEDVAEQLAGRLSPQFDEPFVAKRPPVEEWWQSKEQRKGPDAAVGGRLGGVRCHRRSLLVRVSADVDPMGQPSGLGKGRGEPIRVPLWRRQPQPLQATQQAQQGPPVDGRLQHDSGPCQLSGTHADSVDLNVVRVAVAARRVVHGEDVGTDRLEQLRQPDRGRLDVDMRKSVIWPTGPAVHPRVVVAEQVHLSAANSGGGAAQLAQTPLCQVAGCGRSSQTGAAGCGRDEHNAVSLICGASQRARREQGLVVRMSMKRNECVTRHFPMMPRRAVARLAPPRALGG